MLIGNILGSRSLIAELIGWNYIVCIVPDKIEETGRYLTLICKTSECHFLRREMELNIYIRETKEKPTYEKVVSELQPGKEDIKIGEIGYYPNTWWREDSDGLT